MVAVIACIYDVAWNDWQTPDIPSHSGFRCRVLSRRLGHGMDRRPRRQCPRFYMDITLGKGDFDTALLELGKDLLHHVGLGCMAILEIPDIDPYLEIE